MDRRRWRLGWAIWENACLSKITCPVTSQDRWPHCPCVKLHSGIWPTKKVTFLYLNGGSGLINYQFNPAKRNRLHTIYLYFRNVQLVSSSRRPLWQHIIFSRYKFRMFVNNYCKQSCLEIEIDITTLPLHRCWWTPILGYSTQVSPREQTSNTARSAPFIYVLFFRVPRVGI